ncbi:TPA: hypothetical protein ACIHRY_004709, partial [Salmonella enterica subsp. enterica serovar Typhimurium]
VCMDRDFAAMTKTGPQKADDIECDDVVVDEQVICEEFRSAIKDKTKDQRCIDAALESLKELLKAAHSTKLVVGISKGRLTAVTSEEKVFTGDCPGFGDGRGVL